MNETRILEAVVKSLEARLQENEHRLTSLVGELKEWQGRAHAHCPSCGTRSLKAKTRREKPFGARHLPEAVMMCLSEYDYPINARTLRLKLEESGYPKEKLGRYGNYLHTVICRLVEAGKIQRLEGDEIIAI